MSSWHVVRQQMQHMVPLDGSLAVQDASCQHNAFKESVRADI